MNEFQWLLVLGFPAEVVAACMHPQIFAPTDALTANNRALQPERRESPVIASVIAPERVFLGPL